METKISNAGRPRKEGNIVQFNTKVQESVRDEFYEVCKALEITYTDGLETALKDYVRKHKK